MKDIAIFGSYNKSSIGDKGILIGLIRTIFDHDSDIKITIYCMDKEDIERELAGYNFSNKLQVVQIGTSPLINNKNRNKTSLDNYLLNFKVSLNTIAKNSRLFNYFWECFSILKKYFSFRKFNFVSKHDLLIIGGGNLLMDLYKTWPIILYSISLKAQRESIPFCLIGVGALPIEKKFNKLFLKKTCLNAKEIRVREEISYKAIEDIFHIKADRSPDFAFGLPTPTNNKENDLAINLAAIGSEIWPKKNLELYEKYIKNFSYSAYQIYKNYGFSNIRIINTNLSDSLAAEYFINELISLGIDPTNIIYKKYILSVGEVLDEFNKCKIAITTRLHASIFALLAKNIVFPIEYQPKVRGVIKEINKDFELLDLNKILEEREYIYKTFDFVMNTLGGKSNMLSSETLSAYRKELKVIIEKIIST